MVIVVSKNSFVLSKESANNETMQPENAIEKITSTKKLHVWYGISIKTYIASKSKYHIKKSQSVPTVLHVKSYISFRSSNNKHFKSSICISRNFTSKSSSSSTNSDLTIYNNSVRSASLVSGSTYIIHDLKSSSGFISPHSVSALSSLSRSASFVSTAHISRSSTFKSSSCSKSKLYHSRSQITAIWFKSPPKSSGRPFFKVSKSRYSKSIPVSKLSCVRSTASKIPNSSASGPCLKLYRTRFHRTKLTASRKTYLKLPAPKSLLKPSGNRPYLILHSTLSAGKVHPCLTSTLIVPSTKSLATKSLVKTVPSKRKTFPVSISDNSNILRCPEYKTSRLKTISSRSAYSNYSPSSVLSPPSRADPKLLCPTNFKTSEARSSNYLPSTSPSIKTNPMDIPYSSPRRPEYSENNLRTPVNSNYRAKVTISKNNELRSVKRSRGLRRLLRRDRRRKPSISLAGIYDRSQEPSFIKHTKKDTPYLQKSKMTVCYLTALKHYFNKIRSSFTCGAPECPALQERLRQHKIEHHPESVDVSNGESWCHPECANMQGRLQKQGMERSPGDDGRWNDATYGPEGPNMQGMQQGMRQGMPQGMQNGVQRGMQRSMQNGMSQGMQQGMQRSSMQQGMPQSMQQSMQRGMQRSSMQKGMPQSMQQSMQRGMQRSSMQQGMPQSMQQSMQRGMQKDGLSSGEDRYNKTYGPDGRIMQQGSQQRGIDNRVGQDGRRNNETRGSGGPSTRQGMQTRGFDQSSGEDGRRYNQSYGPDGRIAQQGSQPRGIDNRVGEDGRRYDQGSVTGESGAYPQNTYKNNGIQGNQGSTYNNYGAEEDQRYRNDNNVNKVKENRQHINNPVRKENEIRQWLEKLPIKDGTGKDAKQKKALGNLIDVINSMDLTKRDSAMDEKIKNEIDKYISNVIWYPGSKKDRNTFKEGLREYLFERLVNEKNKNMRNIPKGNVSNIGNNMEYDSKGNVNNMRDDNMRDDNMTDNNMRDDNMRDDNMTDNNMRDDNMRDNNMRDNNMRDNNMKDDNMRDNNMRDNNMRDNNMRNDDMGHDISNINNDNKRYDSKGNINMAGKNMQNGVNNMKGNNTKYYNEENAINMNNDNMRHDVNNMGNNNARNDRKGKVTNMSDDNMRYDKGNAMNTGSENMRQDVSNTGNDNVRYDSKGNPIMNITDDNINYDDRGNAINRKNDNMPYDIDNMGTDDMTYDVRDDNMRYDDNGNIINDYDTNLNKCSCKGEPMPMNERDTIYDLSYGNLPHCNLPDCNVQKRYNECDESLGTCKNVSKSNTTAVKCPNTIKSKDLCQCSQKKVIKEVKICPRLSTLDIERDTIKSKDLCECPQKKVIKKQKMCPGLSALDIERDTIKTKDLCECPQKKVNKKQRKAPEVLDIEKEVSKWLRKSNIIKCNGLLNKRDIIDALMQSITPDLSHPHYSLNKAVLKAKIIAVLREFNDCNYKNTNCGRNIKMNKQADELANSIVGIVSRLACSGVDNWKCDVNANKPYRYMERIKVGPNYVNREDFKQNLIEEYMYNLQETPLENDRDILETIAELIIDRIELIRIGVEETVRRDIHNILQNTGILKDDEIANAIDNIIQNTREIVLLITCVNNRTDSKFTSRTGLSKTLAIYTSEHEITPNFAPPGSSTPKKKKEVSKFGPEEKKYTDEIASTIREWLKYPPDYFQNLQDQKMNELMISEIAGSTSDYIKICQWINQDYESQKLLEYNIFKCLLKFEIIDDVERTKPDIQILIRKLKEINVPKMTRSHYGKRQTIKNYKYMVTEEAWHESFIPEAQDILEDEISIWMNEYPSDIYVDNDKSIQNKKVHEFAVQLQEDKKSDKDISNDVKLWLKNIVRPNEQDRIDMMSKSLMERIDKLPTDETIARKRQERLKGDQTVVDLIPETDSQLVNQEESDKTMIEFIIKYVEHNIDEDDSLAKAAYAKLLKLELQRLSPHVLNEVYRGKPLENFCPDKLFIELGYVKDISDWLKILPLDENYQKAGNKHRLEFCIYLAKDLVHTEEERRRAPDAMNYDEIILGIICQSMHQLPIQWKGKDVKEYVRVLLDKIFARREDNIPVAPHQEWENIADFLDDYIRLNGQDIADDEVKLEVWATRLLAEIKKIIAANPSILPPVDIHDRLAQVAKPGDESIKRFNDELDYAREISDWLKNFPLVNFVDENMVRDLAEKMVEYKDKTDDRELVSYIEQWISKLPLDESKQIDIPFSIQQLLNRRKNVTEKKTFRDLPLNKTDISQKVKPKGDRKSECRGCCPVDNPGSIIVQIIQDWGDALPLEGSEEDVKNAKHDITSKLYLTISEINDDLRLTRNVKLYVETLSDRIDELLSNLSTNVALRGNKEELKDQLLDKIKQARIFIEEITLGDEYMRDVIASVAPNPPPNVGTDPGFESYKENVAELFVLENFDHGKDNNKLKYEQIIKNEIKQFNPNVQQQIGMPTTLEEEINDTISNLFKINKPGEGALTDNVEEIKTKCEILDWFQNLPLQPVSGVAELSQRDQKVRLLAIKLHKLEFEEDPDRKIYNEITKWLTKTPLLPGEEENIDEFAKYLQQILKRTQASRKCVKASDVETDIAEGGSTDDENNIWIPNTVSGSSKTLVPPRLKSTDILIDIVEKWSNNVPLPPLPDNQQKIIKDNLMTQMLKKISELNSDPNIFNNNEMYNHLIKQEIGRAFSELPQSDALIQSQGALMYQLTSAIESVKPLILEERAVHEYKTKVEKTVNNYLGSPKKEEAALRSKVQENIVGNYLEYQYNKNDDEGKQFYKNKTINTLTNFNITSEEDKDKNKGDIIADSLVKANKLICELNKIPPPEQEALQNEIEDLRMKKEIDTFLNKVASSAEPSENTRRNTLRNSLAIQLEDIERTGHSDENNKKIEAAVSRTLKKLNIESNDDEIKLFVEKLEKTEEIRKEPPPKSSAGNITASYMDGTNAGHYRPGEALVSVYQPDYVPPDWKPPPQIPQPPYYGNQPYPSLPPTPVGSIQPSNLQRPQATQTATLRSGMTQTPNQFNLKTGPIGPSLTSVGIQSVPIFPGQSNPPPRIKQSAYRLPETVPSEDFSDESCPCPSCNPYYYSEQFESCEPFQPIFRRPIMIPMPMVPSQMGPPFCRYSYM